MFKSAIPSSEQIPSDKWLALKMPTFESLYGGQVALSTQLIKTNFRLSLSHPRSTTVSLETRPFIHDLN